MSLGNTLHTQIPHNLSVPIGLSHSKYLYILSQTLHQRLHFSIETWLVVFSPVLCTSTLRWVTYCSCVVIVCAIDWILGTKHQSAPLWICSYLLQNVSLFKIC